MRIVICGGRDYIDEDVIYSTLNRAHSKLDITELAHGGARGADTIGGKWATAVGIPVKVYMADWNKWGKAAGHIRNKTMLEDFKPDMVIAFPGGRGTANNIMTAKSLGIRVVEIK